MSDKHIVWCMCVCVCVCVIGMRQDAGWAEPLAHTLQTPTVEGGTVWGDSGRDRARRTDGALWDSFFAPE